MSDQSKASDANPVTADWLKWLRDYAAAAGQLIKEDDIDPGSEAARELSVVKMALYARALTLFEGAILLLENEKQLDFRIHSRGVIEAAIYLLALDNDVGVLEKMKEDDHKSRLSRAELHLNAKGFNASDEVRTLLENFISNGAKGAKPLRVSSLIEGNPFDRLYRTYRDISADAAHVSMTSLSRHYEENSDGRATLMVDPQLDDLDMYVTFAEVGMAMTLATFMLMKIKARTNTWDSFQALLHRYRDLTPTAATAAQ